MSVYCWSQPWAFQILMHPQLAEHLMHFIIPPVSGLLSGTWWCRKAPVTGQEPTSCHIAVPLTSLAQNTAGKHHAALKQSHQNKHRNKWREKREGQTSAAESNPKQPAWYRKKGRGVTRKTEILILTQTTIYYAACFPAISNSLWLESEYFSFSSL